MTAGAGAAFRRWPATLPACAGTAHASSACGAGRNEQAALRHLHPEKLGRRLEQSFNSLDAQREACAAYILSQKGEGWSAVPTFYDDGGYSGGTLERPALQKLLADIASGRIDVVVVYKVDRLTRSLPDFARIVEAFDAQGVSFVSVTQAFNTTTSMGRLTLNVLLSFAQFEREVTGERIRDKIAASKAKGMWMGGVVPLGYDPKDRTLMINEAEAVTVRHIFQRYLELGSVHALVDELQRQGVVSKYRVTRSGKELGGQPFSRGALFHLLRNRIYRGEIVHKGKVHPGLHEAIIAADLFERVQQRLTSNRVVRREDQQSEPSPLAGLVQDDQGNKFTPAHARGKNGRRYRYYVAHYLQTGIATGKSADSTIRRVPATVIEELVIGRLRSLMCQPALQWKAAVLLIRRVELHPVAIILHLSLPEHGGWQDRMDDGDRWHLDEHGLPVITIPGRLKLRGGRTMLVAPAGQAGASRARPDQALIAGLKRAHVELRRHNIQLRKSDGNLMDAKGIADPYLRRLASLAFLAPDIQRAILDGRHPPGLRLQQLVMNDIPLDWNAQRRALGFAT